MSRTSPVHYIAPSAISITPNANGSVNDLAVYVARSTKIRVYSPRAGIGYDGNAEYKQWTLTGRNRRLSTAEIPYTIYARISKSDMSDGYLVFAPQVQDGGVWKDKYPYVTTDGLAKGTAGTATGNYWYIRLGDVSLPSEGKRTVTLDTGILGTDQYNADWSVSPDALPLRVEVSCVVGDEDVGQNAYVYWDQVLVMTASLVEGWTGTDAQRFRHWSITRNTGNSEADAAWLLKDDVMAFKTTGSIRLSHIRGPFDDFGGAVSTLFTVTAWGVPEGQDDAAEADYVALAELPVSILAETAAKYELVLTPNIIGYNPSTDEYSPAGGCVVSLRATDQRSDVFDVTFAQFHGAQLAVSYAEVGSSTWVPLTFSGSDDMPAQAVIPVSAFAAQKSLNVRLVNAAAKELDSDTVAFVRDGEDSRDREWIFLRSQTSITFGDASSEHPAPSYIQAGEVNPSGAAGAVTEDKNQEGWVPEGWWDEQQGTDADNPYEYGSYRDYVRATDEEDGHWGDFSMPRPWNHYGEDGILYSILTDADSVSIPTDRSSVTTGFNAVFQKRAGSNDPAAYECYYAAYRRHGNTYSRFEHSGLTKVSSVAFSDVAVSSDSSSQNYCEAIVIYISDSPLSAGSLQSAPPDSYLTKKEILVIKDGDTGPKGEDAYSVSINPGYAIFEETLGDGEPVVDTSAWVGTVQVLKGSTPQSFKLTYGQHSHCRPTSDSTREDVSVTEATIKFDLVKTEGAYSSEGYIALSVATDDGAYTNTNVKIPYYLSLLDTLEKAASKWFLSKEYDDTAKGNINFEKDVAVGGDISVAGDAAIGRQVDSRNVKTDVVQSHNYTGEGFADTGYRLTSDDGTGSSALTVDNLHVRKKATFEELEVKKETAIAGNQVYSCAANVITRTDYYNGSGDVIGYSKIRSPWLLKGLALVLGKRASNFKLFGRYKTVRVYLPDASQINYVRCYFLAKDGDREIENMWQAGKKDGSVWQNHGNDLARCQTMNLKNSNRKTYISNVSEQKLGNVFWWRKVINVSSEPVTIDGQEYHYFDVSMSDCASGSDIPAAGDHVVQFGNDSDPDRMNLIALEVNGSDAPAEKFYEGIHNYNLNDCYYGGHTMKARLSPKAGYKFQGSKFEIVTEYAVSPVPIERGEWVRGTTYYYYDIVQHNGATWRCVASTGNVYTVVEDIKNGNTVVYPKGTTLNQTKYNALTVSQKMLCTRTSTGSTTLEPSEANSSVWRYYAQQGTSPYFADIENEMDSVVCDKDGKTTAAYSTTFRVYLWHGATEMTLSDITISGTTTDITATKNVTNKTVTVSVAKGKTIPLATELTITPKATGAPNDQSVHFVLNGVRPGADGKPAVLYSIIPSISSIKCDKSNTLTPTSFTCTVQKVSGDSVSTATSTDGTLRYSIDNDITTSTQGTALTIGGTINSYTSSNKYIVLAFFEGTTLRDKERILIVADGSDGNGIVSITTTYARSSQSSTASETTAPTIDGSWSSTMPTLTDTYKYLWRREITTYTDTSKNTTKYFLAAVKGQEGVNGKDGWMVTADPANVIITQSLGTNTTSFSTQAVTFSAKKGNVSATITSIGTPTWTNFTGSKSGTTVTVTSPTRDGSNNYYTEGKFVVSVNVTDPDSGSTVTFSITVPCYANLLGTWKESVENGVKTVIAEEVDYDYLDGVLTKNGRTYTQTATAAGNYETWSSQADTVDGSKANMIKKTTTAQQTADGVSTKVSAITSEVGGQTVLKESQVTQYADEITASVTDGLTDTGIDIVNHTITAKADNFVIKNNSNQTTIQVDSSGNLTTTGNASFSGKISATSGDIGGFSIGTNKINSSNNKIILNDDGTATIGGFSVTSTKTSFTGEITSTSGTIGGFSIGTKDLTNTAYDASIVIQNAASNPTQIARIGKSAVDSMTNQSCSLQAESKGTGTYNTALYLDASSTNSNTYNYAFHGNGNGVLNGLVFGFKTQYITIPSGSSDSLAYIKLQSGATIALKGSHSNGHVVMAAPNIDDVRQCLGLSTSDTTTPFAIEITVFNISSYEYVHVGFRTDTASGTTLGTKYPWLMNYNNIPWPSRHRIQVAQGDILKLMLIYAPSSQGTSSYEYRAYQLLYLS